ncbi:hypothetical protein [Vibrio diazotrophicus]|nr:hypothetical protein [Vibrio diazotrophicus]
MFYLEGKVRGRAGLSNTHRVLAIATFMNSIASRSKKRNCVDGNGRRY